MGWSRLWAAVPDAAETWPSRFGFGLRQDGASSLPPALGGCGILAAA